jgi:uncharacterized membrane protein
MLLTLMYAAALYTWPSAPARIASHWNASGQVDGYAGRFAGLMLMPMIATVIYLSTGLGPILKPGRINEPLMRALRIESFAVIMLLAGVLLVTIATIHGIALNMNTVVWPMLAIIFVATGNLVLRAAQSKIAELKVAARSVEKR